MRGKVSSFPRPFFFHITRKDYRRMMMRNDDAADWSELPVDLIGPIIDELKKNTFFLLDFIRFGAVCFEWRSFSIQNHKQIKLPSNLPVLLIPSPFDDDCNHDDDDDEDEDEEPEKKHDDDDDQEEEEEDEEQQTHDDDNQEEEEEEEVEEEEEEDDDHDAPFHEPRQYYYKRKEIWKGQDQTRYKSTRSFYSLSDRKVNQDFRLPVPYYKNCRGSSYGWLITVDEEVQPDGTTYTYPVRLLNPFRSFNNEIQLPPLTPIPSVYGGDEEPNESYYLVKAYLSANPSSLSNPADLLVFGVYGSNKFGFCRPGDKAWTYLPLDSLKRRFKPIEDLICYKGRFLAIIQEGAVMELEFAHHLPEPSAKFIAERPTNGCIFNKKYLVESGGDLLQVQRHNITDDYSTTGFRAFKLNDDADNDDDKWVEMDNLDGRILFLGDNSSISLSAADFPGVMPNCIYFTDDNSDYYEIFDWDGPHDIGIFNFEDKSIVFDHGSLMPPPIWIQPML